MPKTVNSRTFNQDVSKVKREANHGPVFITEHGKLSHVLLSFNDYQKLTQKHQKHESIIDLLAMPQASDIDFEPKTLKSKFIRPEEFD